MDSHLIYDPADIKILICYVLASLHSPLKGEELCSILSSHGAVNYFDGFDAISDLVRDGFISETEEGCSVTEKGLQIAATFNRKLPSATKQKAVESALRLSAAMRMKVENPCNIEENEKGGFNVNMSVCDGDSELLKISVHASDKEQASLLKKRFESDPMLVYTGIIALLTGDIDSVGGSLLSSPGEE